MKRTALIFLLLVPVLALSAQQASGPMLILRSYGVLTEADTRDSRGRPEDTFTVSAPGEGYLEIIAVSPDFVPRITVGGAGRSPREVTGSGNAARVELAVSDGEELRISVGHADSELAGARFTDYVVVARYSETGSALSVGSSVRGELSSDDETDAEESFIDWYDLALSEGTRVAVTLSSSDFDTYLRLQLPDGRLLENDDEGMGTDSGLSFPVREGGTARVGVTSYGFRSPVTYVLEVRESLQQSLEAGDLFQGDLEGREDVYLLTGTPGERIMIELRSEAFDTYLELTDPEGAYLYNDDAEGFSTSRITYTMGESGEATVTVSAFSDSTGPYELEATEYVYEGPRIRDGYELSDGETVRGQLGPHLPMHENSYRQRFTFRAERSERVEVVLRSDDFDSYLTVVTPDGREITDDDSAGGLDSRIIMTADERGLYEVYASDLGGGSMGRYTLSFTRVGRSRLLLDTRGELTGDDSMDITGKYYDTYRFTVSADRLVTVDVMSDDFDGLAIVRSRTGEVLHQDDDGGEGSNPQISFTAERSETLELVVTTYRSGNTGRYTVTIYE